MDLSKRPIPGGFFCPASQPFSGVIHWKGVPLATGIRGELGNADTIVERMDDAVFNKKGIATTRIHFRALQLESVAPIKTACGDFIVRVMLDGPQPVTRMTIVRDSKYGGHFLAPLALQAKLVFTPVAGGQQLEILRHNVRFPADPKFTWAFKPGSRGLEKRGGVLVDTNFDSVPDTFLAGTSNFAAAWSGSLAKAVPIIDCHLEDYDPSYPDCWHCIEPYGDGN
jgi:hypothetical protein